jgi:transcriptional regulator GlxA family with amidase domain
LTGIWLEVIIRWIPANFGRVAPRGRTTMERAPFRRVAVVLFDGSPLFESSVPLSVFGVDRTTSGAPAFEVFPVASERWVTTTAGIRLDAPHSLAAVLDAEVVVVPTWRDPVASPPPQVLDVLRAAHDRGVVVVGLCLGAFVLAAAGLLDGRRAATHWRYASELAAAHPTIEVDSSVLFVDHGDVLTSAGTAAGIDACLHLVRSAHGARAADAIARRMVVPPLRAGGQSQFIDHALPDERPDADLAQLLTDAIEHLQDDQGVDALAARAHMSRRTFDRQFRAQTGTSPHQWLLHHRVMRAQRLLESTDLSVEAVAREAGFGTAISLRPHFRRIVGVSPQAYRDTFRIRSAS